MKWSVLLTLASVVLLVNADVYMHVPRGNNDRNCERNANRQNANRLFNSQNNAAGGYACPRAEDPATPVGTMYYYEGSVMPIEWTNQHGGGDNPKVHTDVIIQYMAGPDVRDGTPSNKNDAATDTIPDDAQQSKNRRFGMNENFEYYQACKARSRNQGLYTADQNINKQSAIGTRQNPNGERHGFECPEERDYYPYWAPTPWVDVAIITSTPERCPQLIAESENVKGRGFCRKNSGNADTNGETPNNKAACDAKTGYTWVVTPPNGAPAPQCISGNEFYSRNNHLGNGLDGTAVAFNWTVQGIPDGQFAVIRTRYNITTLDNQNNAGFLDRRLFIDDAAAQAVGVVMLAEQGTNGKNVSAVGDGAKVRKNRVWNAYFGNRESTVGRVQFEVFDAAGKSIHRRTESTAPFSLAGDNSVLNAFRVGERYKVVIVPESRSGNPGQRWEANIEIIGDTASESFGTDGKRTPEAVAPYNHVPQDPYIYVGDTDKQFLSLAINTNQYARTFQDRSYVFQTKKRPANVPADAKIVNVQVRGKRGNIVQVYPSVEYDFAPNDIQIETGDYLHFQWTGSDNNPQRGPNDAEGGPGADGNPNNDSRADRSNFVQMAHFSQNFPLQKADLASSSLFVKEDGTTDWDVVNSLAFIGQSKCKTLDQLLQLNAGNRRDNDPENCSKLSAAKAPYFDGGLVKMRKAGQATYFSTRNNNFTNREQKAIITVADRYTPAPPLPKWPLSSTAVHAKVGCTNGACKPHDTQTSGNVKVSWHKDPKVKYYYVYMVNVAAQAQVQSPVLLATTACVANECSFTNTQPMALGEWSYIVYAAKGAWSAPSKPNTFTVA